MDKQQLEEFNPTVVELNTLVAKSRSITISDLKNKTQIEVVKKQRIELKNARCDITNEGKRLREEANAFSKAVITKQKELIAIIEPEEDRLSEIEDMAKAIRIKERRMSELPEKREKLTRIGDGIEELSDEGLAEMDDNAFATYFNCRVSDKNKADRIENERKAQEAEEEALKLRKEEDAKVQAEQEKVRLKQEAKQEEIDEKERKINEAQDKLDNDKRIADAKKKADEDAEQKTKDDVERKEREEKTEAEQRAKDEKYQKFLLDNGYNEDTKKDFHLTDTPETVIIWKKMAVYVK